ncbi:rhodanese-like domain-containing protein [Anaerotignum sp. MB30-C6]|uniref:rhodanese-like domain-containing protein n=1 Tax=Anaerotignum sp. MB30-C6 TaxID=3070814 RepID=UPI0027DCA3DA|nr:rhodanese-like domain-containing protein [Anaerotignum sp. MB30-C6]WMI79825.1 rhodanese-like domain-containing protein [Anaerotignum sp. MB30-C6]
MKTKSIKKILLALLLTLSLFSGCGTDRDSGNTGYQTISASQAYDMIQAEENLIILDVRTQEEFDEGHIPNAILLPNNEIGEKADSILTDKDATILVYCRSGRRSALAAIELAALGYTDVYDFGGMTDWEYDVVVEEK